MCHAGRRHESRGFPRLLRPLQEGAQLVLGIERGGAVSEFDVGVEPRHLVVGFDAGEERRGGAGRVRDLLVYRIRLENPRPGHRLEAVEGRFTAAVDPGGCHGAGPHAIAHEQHDVLCHALDWLLLEHGVQLGTSHVSPVGGIFLHLGGDRDGHSQHNEDDSGAHLGLGGVGPLAAALFDL